MWKLKKSKIFPLVLLLTLLLTQLVTASESDRVPDLTQDTGSLSVGVSYTNNDEESIPIPGTVFSVVKVAGLTVSGGSARYTWLPEFEECGYDLEGMTIGDSIRAAAALEKIIIENGLALPTFMNSTGENGIAPAIDSLSAGIYLIYEFVAPETPDGLPIIAPYLIQVPNPDPTNSNAWVYDVTSYPKPGVVSLAMPEPDTEEPTTEEPTTEKPEPDTEPINPDNTTTAFILKRLELTSGAPLAAKNATYYIALFNDKEMTDLDQIQKVSFRDQSTSVAAFEVIVGKTYYLAETDAKGNPIYSGVTPDGVMYAPSIQPGYEIKAKEGTISVPMENIFSDTPGGFYDVAELEIVKDVKDSDASELFTNEVFHAAIFEDAAHTKLATNLSQNPVDLKMDGQSRAYAYINLAVDQEYTFYIAEVDDDGHVVDDSFDYVATFSGSGKVTFKANERQSITITNTFREEIEESESETEVDIEESESETETEKPIVPPDGPVYPNGGDGQKGDGVKTGDETPILKWVVIGGAALLVILLLLVTGRKKKK